MSNFWNKLDSELKIILSNYLEIREKGKNNVGWIHPSIRETYRLSVKMEYSGNLQPIENLGFKVTHRINDSTARGRLLLEDMERIATNEQVIKLSFGQRDRIFLDTSVGNINVSGEGNVWQINRIKGEFSGITGRGVVIGIIDSGIDYNHPVFLASADPPTTRIKRIWDQGVDAHDGVESPKIRYLDGNDLYGAEYKDILINKVLQKKANPSAIQHKDCNGHGTHVASIAAGDGRAKRPYEPDSKYKYIGVAPEADIVVVKITDLFKEPQAPPEPGEEKGTVIGDDQRFEDAVTYILEVAKLDLDNKPVVINYSMGSIHGPHDGFTEREIWLSKKFGATDTDSKGLFVTSAGNSANKGLYAIAKIPGDVGTEGEMTIPFELYDKRIVKTSFDRCKVEDDTKNLQVDMWYKNIPSGSITPHLTPPKKSTLPGLPVGDKQDGYLGKNNQYYFIITHSTEPITRPAIDGNPEISVIRNNINLRVCPNKGSFIKGTYTIRLTGPTGAEIHIWSDIGYGNSLNPKRYGLRFDDPDSVEGLELKKVGNEEHLIGPPGGAKNILTVAAYRDPSGNITSFSSRGPLVDYSPLADPYIKKPDIAAPGSGIMAAESNHTNPPGKSPCCQSSSPPDYVQKGGTSMSSPHVAGVAALLLQKKGTLTTSQLINIIKNNPADTNGDILEEDLYGKGRIDAKKAIANVQTP